MTVEAGLKYIKKIPEAQRVFDELGDKKDFSTWFTGESDMLRGDITTAVHESVHMIRSNTGKYILLNGGWIDAPEGDDESIPAPSKYVSPELKSEYTGDSYFDVYMVAGDESASSAEYFSYLLDEFNAYCFDMHVFSRLGDLPINSTPRDGLASFMLFTLVYLDKAKPQLTDAQQRALVAIWKQAENVMDETANMKNVSFKTEKYLSDAAPLLGVMHQYLGRNAKDFRGVGHITDKVSGEIDVEATESSVPVYRRFKNFFGVD